MAHTPGPWTYECTPNVRAICDARGAFIARFHGGIRSIRPEDATLIAAAPDLLSTLEALVANHPRQAARPGMTEPDELANARAAIAKAKGA